MFSKAPLARCGRWRAIPGSSSFGPITISELAPITGVYVLFGMAHAEAGHPKPTQSPAMTTAPFDLICPLCFIREWIESGFRS